jgi:cytochrome P450
MESILNRTFTGTKPSLTIGNPDLIKQVLVKDFHLFRNRSEQKLVHPIISKNMFNSRDDEWKRLRSIASPTFTSGKMKKMFPLIRECTTEFLEHLETYAKDGKYDHAY